MRGDRIIIGNRNKLHQLIGILVIVIILISLFNSYFLSKMHLENLPLSFRDTKIKTSSIVDIDYNSNELSSQIPPIGSLDESEFNVSSSGDYYDSYNLMVLDKTNRVTHVQEIHLVVIDMEGNIISKMFLGSASALVYSVAKFINSTTAVIGGIHTPFLWNFFRNTTQSLSFNGHHDYEYNSNSNTFFTLKHVVSEIDGFEYLFDEIVEYDLEGNIVWSVSTQSFVSHTQWCPFQDINWNARSVTHCNSINYNPKDDTLLLSCRNLNTIYKINHTSSEVIWALGEYGDFDLYDRHGQLKTSLFYHSHASEWVDEETIILFDNDFHNQTNPDIPISRIVEITINEEKKTANESWSYSAPEEFYSSIWGDADRLPNGNRLGTFGEMHHSASSHNAEILEVNSAGEVVWQLGFYDSDFYYYSIYRVERFSFTPLIEDVGNIESNSIEETEIQWDIWSNFRSRTEELCHYRLYLNGTLFKEATQFFSSFWRKTSLEANLGILSSGVYNLTLIIENDSNHSAKSTVIIDVKPFYIRRNGSQNIEFGQAESFLIWNGEAETSLHLNLTIGGVLFNSTSWISSDIALDLNSLGLGEHLVELHLFNNTNLIYNETFFAAVYLLEPPQIITTLTNIMIEWGDVAFIQWNIFDNTPKQWEIYVNGSLYKSNEWEAKNIEINWLIPNYDEAFYNITLKTYDNAGFTASSEVHLLIISPSPPVVYFVNQKTDFQYGIGNITLSWIIHGECSWFLWNNDQLILQGDKQGNLLEFVISNWDPKVWGPGKHNVTLEVIDANSGVTTSLVWVMIWMNLADAHADFLIVQRSAMYLNGENALGAPDGHFTSIVQGYTNGYVTLDMGFQEEILNRNGDDFIIHAKGGDYFVWLSNDIDAPFIYLGEGNGNLSFNLASVSMDQARYIRIQYAGNEYTQLDAIEALYYNKPTWDDVSPIILAQHDLQIWSTVKEVITLWDVFDSNPLNYSITINNELYTFGEWNGSMIVCSVPVNSTGIMSVALILFDAFGNTNRNTLTIEVLSFSLHFIKYFSIALVGTTLVGALVVILIKKQMIFGKKK
ncbi:MAG: hypothetical protein GPJ51_02085 [Candidatus Heimdallarchaeota archaeon]|nr:hypothetical protein [Candidatus Heimdallarchaeota archaeon]